MRIITSNSREAVTTIAVYRAGFLRALLNREGTLLRRLRRIPGFTSGSIFRSYDRRSAVLYLQWTDQQKARAACASPEYRSCASGLGDPVFPVTSCEVTFVDDARPVEDHLKAMVLDPHKDDNVTLIGTFHVQPDRREELLALLRRDHQFLREFDGFVSVAFHRAIERDDTVVEVLRFQSVRKLRAVSKTPRGAAHLAAVDGMANLSANLYRLSSGFQSETEPRYRNS